MSTGFSCLLEQEIETKLRIAQQYTYTNFAQYLLVLLEATTAYDNLYDHLRTTYGEQHTHFLETGTAAAKPFTIRQLGMTPSEKISPELLYNDQPLGTQQRKTLIDEALACALASPEVAQQFLAPHTTIFPDRVLPLSALLNKLSWWKDISLLDIGWWAGVTQVLLKHGHQHGLYTVVLPEELHHYAHDYRQNISYVTTDIFYQTNTIDAQVASVEHAQAWLRPVGRNLRQFEILEQMKTLLQSGDLPDVPPVSHHGDMTDPAHIEHLLATHGCFDYLYASYALFMMGHEVETPAWREKVAAVRWKLLHPGWYLIVHDFQSTDRSLPAAIRLFQRDGKVFSQVTTDPLCLTGVDRQISAPNTLFRTGW